MAFQAKHAQGQVIAAPTLAELAAKIGIDPVALAKTIDTYNTFVDQGKDLQFGRDGLSTHYGALARIDTAPFYAYPSKSVIVATYCGVSVDPQMRVRDVFGAIIPNLYAAGEVIGGLHGRAYMTGSSLGKASIFGRLAGRSAVGAVARNAAVSA
jgi:succinate dehydrogenase/fumarate reductase flavoprotein subunit